MSVNLQWSVLVIIFVCFVFPDMNLRTNAGIAGRKPGWRLSVDAWAAYATPSSGVCAPQGR